MKVLLTGVSGFIGSRLLTALCDCFGADNVIAVSSKTTKQCETIVYDDNYSIDLNHFDKISDVELIIHAGAFTPKSRTDANNIDKCNGNIDFTRKLLSLPFERLKKIFYLSTLDVYGDDEVISESTRLDPSSLYGMSKLYCEKMVSSFCDSANIRSQILRIGHVYGPGEEKYQKLLPIAIKKVLNGQEVELWGDGSELRSFIYIKDVIDACLTSIELSDDVGVINVVSEQSISIANLLAKVAEILNTELKCISKPFIGVKKSLLFDNSKMKRFLLETETPFIDGLTDEIVYFKDIK
ncbi:NAD(P)-dependent oxidoreductase [Colwellia sp. 75C3]|uniref:NAD-dependent epimerase/dehydratase family protein n=1 Tax=Colwellia sp. 75C3 TaxID=888425 RepID=UPI000C33133B|nr:NAD(P)-dependent oxidoreductase [Colwellia sp. 75C3]PKG82236.1 NAD(P)-dependent oxidoreductase [Colwellia sp. 75C3]